MNQYVVAWGVLVAGSLAAGVCVVGVLVAKRTWELPFAVAGTVGFGSASYSLALFPQLSPRPDAVLWAFAFMVASGVGGFALASSLLYRLAQTRSTPPSGAVHDAPTTVIVTACIEPEYYEPRSTAGMLQQLTDEDLLEPSLGALPFLFFAQKARYRALAGRSPASPQLRALSDRLHAALSPGASVGWATCSGPESVVGAVSASARGGRTRIVVAGVSVSDSIHYVMTRNAIDDLRAHIPDLDVTFTPPLFDSDRLIAMLANRIEPTVRDHPGTGVVLVGHGQPEPRAQRNPRFDEEELAFLSRLRMALIERGVGADAVQVAYADWTHPDVTTSVRHLAAMGSARVLVVPATFPFDTLATRLDLEIAVRQARVDESVDVVVLPAWGDDEAVVAEVHARITAALERDA